jgi:CHAD domain-containing protein
MSLIQLRGDDDPALASTVERETKLIVDEVFRLPRLPGRPLPRRVFTSTYYDSLDHCLAQGQITLRYRVEGGLGLWQLKLPLVDGRREVEFRGEPGVVPRVFSDALVVHLEGKRLAPVATLRTWRTGTRVTLGRGMEADVVLDAVSVMMGDTIVQRFHELEIEWRTCDDGGVDRLVHELCRAGARRHDGRPKLFRALSMAYGPGVPPPKDAPVKQHLRHYLMSQVDTLKRHDPGTRLGGEPEDLHLMRVSTRKLRAVLRAAHRMFDAEWAAPLISGLTWLGQLFGFVRDLDVQLEYFKQEASELSPRDRKPLERFVARLQNDRDKARQVLADEMKSARYVSFLHKLHETMREPILVDGKWSLTRIAKRQFKKLTKEIGKLPRSPSNMDLHRVRIKAKRARYVAELVEMSQGKPVARFAKSAKQFQDLLGRHQDSVLAERHVRDLVAKIPGERTAFVGGLLVARARQQREEARDGFRTAWRKLKKRGKKAWG